MENVNLTPLIQAIIAVLAALITYKLVPWIRSRTTAQQQANLQTLIRVLVYAAEQIYGAGSGQRKLDYVCSILRQRGYEVSLPEIEAEVYKAFNMHAPIIGDEGDDGHAEDTYADLAKWSLDQLKSYCAMNGIAADGCVTEEDFIDAIERGGRAGNAPPNETAAE